MREYIKTFNSFKRFYSEFYYYNVFCYHKFDVIKRINVNIQSRNITYDYVIGSIPSTKDIKKIIDLLINIHIKREQIIPLLTDDYNKSTFIYLVNNSLREYNFSKTKIEFIILTLLKRYKCSIFKDSKLTNWIIPNDSYKIIMIDFDYVIPSFFLQDLAQFLTSFQIYNNIDINYDYWLNYFISNTFSSINEELIMDYEMLFYVSCLVSNLKKIKYKMKYDYINRFKNIKLINSILIKKLKVKVVSHANFY